MSVFGDRIYVLSLLISGKLLTSDLLESLVPLSADPLDLRPSTAYHSPPVVFRRCFSSLSYSTTPVLFSTSASTLWAKLPHQLELAESLNLNVRSGNGVLVRNAAMAEKRSLLALTGAIIRLRKLRLREMGPRMILLLL